MSHLGDCFYCLFFSLGPGFCYARVTELGSFCPMRSKQKCWDAEVRSKERVYSQGSQPRRWENKSQIYLPSPPARQGAAGILGYRTKKQGALRRGERREREKRCVIHVLSRRNELRASPRWNMEALARAEGRVLGSLTSPCHRADTHACSVGGSGVLLSLDRLAGTGQSWLQVPGKHLR